MRIQIKILNDKFYKSEGDLPGYATAGSAAIDLRTTTDVTVYPGAVVAVNTGIALNISIPSQAYETYQMAGLLLPRSGVGTKGLILANNVGLIDQDYQGEIVVQLLNRTHHDVFKLAAGDRIAQLTFIPVIHAGWELVDEFTTPSDRGTNGFGSTGN